MWKNQKPRGKKAVDASYKEESAKMNDIETNNKHISRR